MVFQNTTEPHFMATTSVPVRCATAQCHFDLVHFQHSEVSTVIYIYCIALLTVGTLQWFRICMVVQLHALSAQQN